MRPTPFPEVNELLKHLIFGAQDILGDNLVGAYLFGSLAIGAFNVHSDIDAVIVCQHALQDAQIARLAALHEQIAALPNRWATEIEASYLPSKAFRRHDPLHCIHPHIDRGRGELLVARWRHDEDWIIQRHVLYEHGVVLYGPDVRTLLDPVSRHELREAVIALMRTWWLPMLADSARLAHMGYQAYAALTMCRMARTLELGDVVSKLAAAVWMQAQQPQFNDLLRRALDWQLTHADIPHTQALIALVARRAGL